MSKNEYLNKKRKKDLNKEEKEKMNEKENKDEKSKEKIKGNIIIGDIKGEKNNIKKRIINSSENDKNKNDFFIKMKG